MGPCNAALLLGGLEDAESAKLEAGQGPPYSYLASAQHEANTIVTTQDHAADAGAVAVATALGP